MNPSPCPTPFANVSPGQLNFDCWLDAGISDSSAQGFFRQFEQWIAAASWNRNYAVCRRIVGRQAGSVAGFNRATNTIVWFLGTLDPLGIAHETCHAFARCDEGASANGGNPTALIPGQSVQSSLSGVLNYTDPFTPTGIGQGGLVLLNAPYAAAAGFLDGKLQCAQPDGQPIRLAPYEPANADMKAVCFWILSEQQWRNDVLFDPYRLVPVLVSDRRWYVWLEHRKNHPFKTSGGKGRRKTSGTNYAPGVQIRVSNWYPYPGDNQIGDPPHVSSFWLRDAGNNGGLSAGQSWTFRQRTTKAVAGIQQPDVTSLVRLSVDACDSSGATIRLSYA